MTLNASDLAGELRSPEMVHILAQALATASRQLVEHRSSLDRLTHALLERETLEAAALEALLAVSAPALSA